MSLYYTPAVFNRHTLGRAEALTSAFAAVDEGFSLLPAPTAFAGGTLTFGVESGSGNSYVVDMPNALLSLDAGQEIVTQLTHTNTGAATINVDGLGAKSIRRVDGTQTVAGDLVDGTIVVLRYTGTLFVMISATRGDIVAAAASAAAALASANEAAASASSASGSAGSATASASAASGSAAAAAGSQSAAATSASNAASAAAAAAAASFRLIPSGTAAEPSLAFDGDQNNGFYRPAADQIGASTNGVRRWLLSNTAFQIDVQITGTAVTQNFTDRTSGRILKVGDYGLGGSILFTNCNDAVETGNYYAAGGTFSNGPSAVANTAQVGLVVDQLQNPSNLLQTLNVLSDGRTYKRNRVSGTWSGWRRGYDSANLIGTVAQIGGVPTEDIIERDSNANGEYVRFADGTQICTGETPAFAVDNLVGSVYKSAAQALAFPASFSSVPHCGGSIENTLNSWCNVRASNSSNWQITGWSFAARATDVVKVYAIGRWF